MTRIARDPMEPELPPAPSDAYWTFDSGPSLAMELQYVGRAADGTYLWEPTGPPPARATGVAIRVLPPRTAVRVPL